MTDSEGNVRCEVCDNTVRGMTEDEIPDGSVMCETCITRSKRVEEIDEFLFLWAKLVGHERDVIQNLCVERGIDPDGEDDRDMICMLAMHKLNIDKNDIDEWNDTYDIVYSSVIDHYGGT